MDLEKLERKHTENPDGRYFVPLANAYRKLGETDHAEHLLREGLRRHPDYLSAHIVLGRCLADQSEFDAAAEEFRHVLSVDAQNLVALSSLGEIAQAAGRREDAERWYRELLAVDPMNEEARRALDGSRDDGAATAPDQPVDIGEVLDLSEPDAETELVTETIADLYAKQGFYDRAAAVYRELIRRNGSSDSLEERLAAVEQRASAGDWQTDEVFVAEEPRAPEDFGNVEPLPDADTFAESFSGGFDGDITSDDPFAGTAPPAEPPATIQTYLQNLLAWTPGHAESRADEPDGTDLAMPGEQVDEDEWNQEYEGDRGIAEAAGFEFLPDEQLPWEMPGTDPLDESLATPEEGADAQAEPTTETDAARQTAGNLPSTDESDDTAAGEDDDLESFQAWLRSLKR